MNAISGTAPPRSALGELLRDFFSYDMEEAMRQELLNMLQAGAVSPDTALTQRQIPFYDPHVNLAATNPALGLIAWVERGWLRKVRRYYLTAKGLEFARG